MKQLFLLFIGVFFCSCAVSAQDSLLVDTAILTYDDLNGIPDFKIQAIGDSLLPMNRIASLNLNSKNKSFEFWVLMAFSTVLTLLMFSSREQVKMSFRSIFSSSFALQQSRTERQGNAYFYYLYLMLFILSFAFLLHFSFNNIYFHQRGYWTFVILVFAYFVMDFIFSVQTALFSNSNRIIDILLASSLNYALVLCFLVWPALFFVVFAKISLAYLISILFFVLIGWIYLVKEWRILQILANERVEVYSFHFFAYLCSFKILPIIVLIKVLLS
ncbi:MAG: DUF4271 domain-containing protein [Chitinophagales bacterium]|nr:DUF4271 domain-containing protein [Bacteroidota bacterium]MCB9255981.1 DUF4271 domain-containing protein [Chitinophagales bacterium]